jgi:hypothetical protein
MASISRQTIRSQWNTDAARRASEQNMALVETRATRTFNVETEAMNPLTVVLAAALAMASIAPALAQDDSAWVEQKAVANDGADNSYFGSAAALAGTTAVIGADGDATFTGATYVLSNSSGTWSQVQKLVPDDGAHGDTFGYRVALAVDTLVVTAYSASPNGNTAQGAAYVFERSGETWSQSQKLVADDGVAFDDFGASARLDGSLLFIGANGAIVGSNAAQGALYVFAHSGDTWAQAQKVIADDGAAFDNFGFSVASSADTLFVGAPNAFVDGTPGVGAVYVYTLQGGLWTQTQKLAPDEIASFGAFGESVAFDGTTLFVGASGASAAYVFTQDGGSWIQVQRLSGDDTQSGDGFGNAIALSGAKVLIGSDIATVDGLKSRGAAYLFSATDSGWAQSHKFVASDGTTDDFFGAALALDGDTAILSTPHPVIDGHPYEGAAYFYTRDTLFADGFDG